MIETIQKCIPLLDEVYASASKTAILETPQEFVRETAAAGTVLIPDISMDGLADYDRQNGFVDGDVSLTWKPYELAHDRGRSFQIDNMDDKESLGVAFAKLAGEFLRTKVVPEIDAVRFAAYAAGSGYTPTAATPTEDNAVSLLDAAIAEMQNADVDLEGGFLFMSPEFRKLIRNSSKWTWNLLPGNNPNRGFTSYDDLKTILVPQKRFYTEVALNDGKTEGQTAGGYASAGKAINFMIVAPSAVTQITKHAKARVFAPDVNQKADAYKIDYRIYHDGWVQKNKKMGVYTHHKA